MPQPIWQLFTLVAFIARLMTSAADTPRVEIDLQARGESGAVEIRIDTGQCVDYTHRPV
ncbi:MAG: hypothetical protein GVY16_08860 [Planctomycetes bacterium]|jgi:hypothetical protein|nr:hypothetical protein [Planctomycetota bacterium]